MVESALEQVAVMEKAVQFAAVLLNGGRIVKEAASEGQAPRVSLRTHDGKDFVLTDGLIRTRFPASLLEGLLERGFLVRDAADSDEGKTVYRAWPPESLVKTDAGPAVRSRKPK